MLDCHTVLYDCQGLGQEQAITPFENLQKINNEGMVKGVQYILLWPCSSKKKKFKISLNLNLFKKCSS